MGGVGIWTGQEGISEEVRGWYGGDKEGDIGSRVWGRVIEIEGQERVLGTCLGESDIEGLWGTR